MGKQKCSHTKTRKIEPDYCSICKEDLSLNEITSKRIGMLGEDDHVCGWICPYCKSEFNLYDIVTNIYGDMEVKGEA